MWAITKLETYGCKIAYDTLEELVEKVNALEAYRISSIASTSPGATDTRTWVYVSYQKRIM